MVTAYTHHVRKAAPILLAALIAPAVFGGEVQVRPNGGRVDVIATAAPLQDVLARLSQQTGMKVVYDGAPPRTLVTVSLPQRTPVEAVLSLFEGLGLNYALSTDKSGTKVDMLIISSAASGAGAAPRAAVAPPAPMVPDPRRLPPRPQPAPDADRDEDEQQADEDIPRPQAQPTPPGPVIFQGPIPGPGVPGSPFGNQIGPLTLPTPVPAVPGAPVRPTPAPTPTPSPTS